MNSSTREEHYILMGADNMPVGCAEKPKPRLFTAVLPSVWFVKLRSRRRKSRNLKAASDSNVEPVIPDNAPFLPKTVQNCYRSAVQRGHGSEASSTFDQSGRIIIDTTCPCREHDVAKSVYVFTTPSRRSLARSEGGGTPSRRNSIARSEPGSSTPNRKSIARSEPGSTATRSTPMTSIATTTSSPTTSIFSRCMYRSTFFSGLRSLCKLVDDDESSLSPKGCNSMQIRKTATPTMRAWFLVGCGGTPRPRTRHSSLDLEKEPGFMELDAADPGLDCIDERRLAVEASWPRKAESWSGSNSAPWISEQVATNDEVVKNQVVVKKNSGADNFKESSVMVKSPVKVKPGAKPTLGHLFSTRSDTDSPRKGFPETTEEESEIHIEDPKLVTLPWRSMSFGSDSTFRVPSVGSADSGLTESEPRPFSFSESEAPSCTDDLDTGNISDSQSLLRAKMLAAERVRERSNSWRVEVSKLDMKQKDDEAVKLLASLDQALDQRNLKRLIEDDEDSDPGYASMFGSPRFELHNSPVFESFLESSAKAWGIDFPSLKIEEANNSGSISDNTSSRELHCITVQTATQLEKARELAQERNRRNSGRMNLRNNPSPPATTTTTAKIRKASRRPVDQKESAPKRPSPPSKKTPPKQPSPPLAGGKNSRDQRTIHPQREESMVDPELHDEFNHARKKFNEERKRSKQRRSKQVASVPDSASPPAAPAPAPSPPPVHVPAPSPPAPPKQQPPAAVKERVAVVVESSYDPYNDFRESMIEMIVDQDIQESGDLEELLQCYLSLNEAEYHNVIVDVFTDVWHELFENKF